MLGKRSANLASRASVLLLSVILAGFIATPAALTPDQSAAAQGTVKIEWLGHEFFRVTSPEGVVVLTSPWLDNADGPVPLESLSRADIILVPNSHNDDMGNPIEVAEVSGATVVAPGPTGTWLIENGLPREQFVRVNVGSGTYAVRDTMIKFGPSDHDNTLPNGQHGGPAASFFMVFNNGTSVFFSGHATMIADLIYYSAVYQPDVALLGLNHPGEFAQAARLLAMENPKLRTIIPTHIRPGDAIIRLAEVEMERVGLRDKLFLPELRTVYEY
jgi:L-ascorbate metabolism protein UlaG (beta-lactamase superfamily)